MTYDDILPLIGRLDEIERCMAELLGKLNGAHRSPVSAARILTLIVLLDGRVPWYRKGDLGRPQLSKLLGCSAQTFDVVLSKYEAQGLIKKRIEVVPGQNRQRPSTNTLTYYDPQPQLRAMVVGCFARRP